MRARSLRTARARGRGTAGFLLMETLATFTISAFVLLGLVSAASVLLRAVDVSVARVEHVDDLGRAMESIRRDIAGISRNRWNGIEPQPFVFRGGPNSLYFAHVTRGPNGAEESEAVTLREIVVSGRPTMVQATARLGAHASSFADLAFGPQREVWTGTARLRFSFLPQSESREEPPPRSSWPVGLKLPAAILVEAVDRDTRRVIVATRVTIEANADIGCLGDGDTSATSVTTSTAPLSTQPGGSGGVDFGAVPQVQALPPAIAQPGSAPQAGDGGAFCSRADDAGDKTKQSTSPLAPLAPPVAAAAGTTP